MKISLGEKFAKLREFKKRLREAPVFLEIIFSKVGDHTHSKTTVPKLIEFGTLILYIKYISLELFVFNYLLQNKMTDLTT